MKKKKKEKNIIRQALSRACYFTQLRRNWHFRFSPKFLKLCKNIKENNVLLFQAVMFYPMAFLPSYPLPASWPWKQPQKLVVHCTLGKSLYKFPGNEKRQELLMIQTLESD